MTVRELKSWLRTHNPALLHQASRTTNTISHPSTNQKPSTANAHTNPPPALHNDENEAHDNSAFTPTNEDTFELDSSDMPLGNDFVDDAGYNEEIIPPEILTSYQSLQEPEIYNYEDELKTNVFSKIKKFVHKNPKTSVGIGTAVLTLGGTIIYILKQLFTRQTKRSQTKNQINQKYNQYVKNKI